MSSIRTIKRIIQGQEAVDGAGVRLTRVFGHRDTRDFDPFLMLDAFDSTNSDEYTKGFPAHPHRGIETITYLIEGTIVHGDSLGNKGVIESGDCQWMTAGSGIIHQEMPQASSRILGAQLWLNLSAKDKGVPPQYRDIKKADIPRVEGDGSIVRIIAGSYGDTEGSFQGEHAPVTYLDVELLPGHEWHFESDPAHTAFAYIFQGSGSFGEGDGAVVAEKNAVLFSEGSMVRIRAKEGGMRFLFVSAKPLGEPIAWGGPVAMNTQEELDQAFQEIADGTFIK